MRSDPFNLERKQNQLNRASVRFISAEPLLRGLGEAGRSTRAWTLGIESPELLFEFWAAPSTFVPDLSCLASF